MDKAQRAKLLKTRFEAIGGFPFVFAGVRKPTPAPRPKPDRIRTDWPEAIRNTARAGIWMHTNDPKPKVIPKTKRYAGEPILTKIARKMPGKLVRRVASAEALLGERARQSRL